MEAVEDWYILLTAVLLNSKHLVYQSNKTWLSAILQSIDGFYRIYRFLVCPLAAYLMRHYTGCDTKKFKLPPCTPKTKNMAIIIITVNICFGAMFRQTGLLVAFTGNLHSLGIYRISLMYLRSVHSAHGTDLIPGLLMSYWAAPVGVPAVHPMTSCRRDCATHHAHTIINALRSHPRALNHGLHDIENTDSILDLWRFIWRCVDGAYITITSWIAQTPCGNPKFGISLQIIMYIEPYRPIVLLSYMKSGWRNMFKQLQSCLVV